MIKDKAIDIVVYTLEKSFEILQNNSTWQPIVSVRNQLKYILEALRNENDRFKLNEIDIGLYVVREFENDYNDFADRLHEVSGICRLMIKGKL
ncbi:hypothetical protein FIA56_03005 [Testudinibacter sp. TR-2022]|uniref:immunity protein Tsi6 family protein n=2 Tax=Testudinibacter sp. TR-2022 TaxID=2585029 RepID=UPI001119D246|nr:immunity protein Tsi6 family protein [Testudinibacter sp. TR-2022]TNH13255.1 hypothetical protein FHQ23_12185 [Testudinibacter sp. TR-2022]TNH15599.1 hypothetical protein FIA56_03005 [Testudinibacter sp. TR-2022]